MNEKEKKEREERRIKGVITFRLFQAFFLGIFALGLALIAGDLTTYAKIPISSFALTTTSFGGLGAIITEILARQAKKW